MRAECLIAFDEKEGGLITELFTSFKNDSSYSNITPTPPTENIFASLSFNGFDFKRDIIKSILFINSLKKDTKISINILSHAIYNIEDPASDALLALFTAIEYSQLDYVVNWHTNTNILYSEDLCTIWRTLFPTLYFIPIDLHSESESGVNHHHHINVQLPSIGSCRMIPTRNYDPILFSNLRDAIFLDTFHKDQLCAFFDTNHSVQLSQANIIQNSSSSTSSSKASSAPFLDTSFGFLFKIEKFDKIAFVFFDLSLKELNFINSAYVCFIYNLVTKKRLENENQQSSVSFSSHNNFNEKSFSFSASSALASDSIDCQSSNLENIKRQNKETLKKLILLSLRRIGIKKNDSQFSVVWKHLYCGCIFSLRNELGSSIIEQSKLFQTIRENVKFLNIK